MFFWALIPHFIALIECFFMPGRVRRYNEEQAYLIAAQVRAAFPATPMPPAAAQPVLG